MSPSPTTCRSAPHLSLLILSLLFLFELQLHATAHPVRQRSSPTRQLRKQQAAPPATWFAAKDRPTHVPTQASAPTALGHSPPGFITTGGSFKNVNGPVARNPPLASPLAPKVQTAASAATDAMNLLRASSVPSVQIQLTQISVAPAIAQQPPNAADGLNLTTTVVNVTQNDATALLQVELRVDGLLPAQMITSPSIKTDSPTIVTSVTITAPQFETSEVRSNESVLSNKSLSSNTSLPLQGTQTATFQVTLGFNGDVGVAVVRALVSTFAAAQANTSSNGSVFAADIVVNVAGITVPTGDPNFPVISGSGRQGVQLGSYKEWINSPIVVLPLNIWPHPVSEGQTLSETFQVQFAPILERDQPADFSANAPPVEALNLPSGQTNPNDVIPVCTSDNDNLTGQVVANGQLLFGQTHSNVSFPIRSGCTVAVNSMVNQIGFRLAPYLVGTYGFQMLLKLQGVSPSQPLVNGTNSTQLSLLTRVNFWFDTSDVPPPLFPGTILTLDRYGGEVVIFDNVRNLHRPPRFANLIPQDLVMLIYSGFNVAPLVIPSTNISNTSMPGNFEVNFLTPRQPILAPEPTVHISFNDQTSGTSTSRWQVGTWTDRGHYTLRASSNESLGQEVAYEGTFSSRFAPATLAIRGSCDGAFANANGTVPSITAFGMVDLKLPLYTASNFSDYKANLLTYALGGLVGITNSPDDARFFDINGSSSTASFEILIRANASATQIQKIIQGSLAQGYLQKAARIPFEAIEYNSFRVLERSTICSSNVTDRHRQPPKSSPLGRRLALILPLSILGAIILTAIVLYTIKRCKSDLPESSEAAISDRDRQTLGNRMGLHALTQEHMTRRRTGTWKVGPDNRNGEGGVRRTTVPLDIETESGDSREGWNDARSLGASLPDRERPHVLDHSGSLVGSGHEIVAEDDWTIRPDPRISSFRSSMWTEQGASGRGEYMERDFGRPYTVPDVFRSESSETMTGETENGEGTSTPVTENDVLERKESREISASTRLSTGELVATASQQSKDVAPTMMESERDDSCELSSTTMAISKSKSRSWSA